MQKQTNKQNKKTKKRRGHKDGQKKVVKKKGEGMFCHGRRKEDSQHGTAEIKHQKKSGLSLVQL